MAIFVGLLKDCACLPVNQAPSLILKDVKHGQPLYKEAYHTYRSTGLQGSLTKKLNLCVDFVKLDTKYCSTAKNIIHGFYPMDLSHNPHRLQHR